MEIVSFTITGTFPKEDVENYSRRRGWISLEESNISALDFAKDSIKNVIVGDVSRGTQETIVHQMELEKQRVLEEMSERVKGSISVEYAESKLDVEE